MPLPANRAPQAVDRLDILGWKDNPKRNGVPHVHGRGAKERDLDLALDGGCAAFVAERGPHLSALETRLRGREVGKEPTAARVSRLPVTRNDSKPFDNKSSGRAAFGLCRLHQAARMATARRWAAPISRRSSKATMSERYVGAART